MQQLPLGITLKPGITFDNYVAGKNGEAVENVHACANGTGSSFLYLWGEKGVGKSHLLQAACAESDRCGYTTAYIPFREAAFAPEILAGLENLKLICLDDLEETAGDPDWEEALFNLFNRLRDRGGHLLIAADNKPANLDLSLPDLGSRLTWGLGYRIHPLSEEERRRALIQAAGQRGMEMPDEVARYLLTRCPRDMGTLLGLTEQLDRASLAARRRLTIPFVREQLASFQLGDSGLA